MNEAHSCLFNAAQILNCSFIALLKSCSSIAAQITLDLVSYVPLYQHTQDFFYLNQ